MAKVKRRIKHGGGGTDIVFFLGVAVDAPFVPSNVSWPICQANKTHSLEAYLIHHETKKRRMRKSEV
jgi:molybdopterin-guanine dinucleotide biosynthesis protein A